MAAAQGVGWEESLPRARGLHLQRSLSGRGALDGNRKHRSLLWREARFQDLQKSKMKENESLMASHQTLNRSRPNVSSLVPRLEQSANADYFVF